MKLAFCLIRFVAAAALAAVAAAQPFPLPPRPDGYLLLNSATAQVKIDAVSDPTNAASECS